MEHGESSERQTNNEERVDAGKMRENAAALSEMQEHRARRHGSSRDRCPYLRCDMIFLRGGAVW